MVDSWGGLPNIERVSIYIRYLELDYDQPGEAVLYEWKRREHSGYPANHDRVEYRISDLYRRRRNAEAACYEKMKERLAHVAADVEKFGRDNRLDPEADE